MAEGPEGELLIGLANLQSKIHKMLGAALSVHGISLIEYLVLHQLHLAPGHKLRRVDLAEKVSLSASGVTRLINPLQKIGLVEKEANARDARVSLVVLSTAGEQIFKDAKIAFDDAAKAILAPVDPSDQLAFSNLLKSLI